MARGRRRQSTVKIYYHGDEREQYRSAEGGVAIKSNKSVECIKMCFAQLDITDARSHYEIKTKYTHL